MDKIDYIKIGLISPRQRDRMMKVEKTLVKNEFCTNEQLQEISRCHEASSCAVDHTEIE